MRTIKFRGKDIGGEWAHGNLTITTLPHNGIPTGTYISNSVGRPFAYHVRPETVGQFIGELDENKLEIYEGDIVQKPVWLSSDDPCNGIYFDEGIIEFKCAEFVVESEDDFYDNMGPLFSWNEVKVIGNIHS